MTTEELISHIRVIPDYPVPGIMFQDITTLMKDPECFREVADRLYEHYKDKGITKVVGLESRGFIMGAVLAYRLGAGFVLIRKAGKLPAEKITERYTKEYGYDTFEMHTGCVSEDDVVLLHDDLLATGGTVAAAYRLTRRFNPSKTYVSFTINLTDCPRVDNFPADVDMFSVIEVEENK